MRYGNVVRKESRLMADLLSASMNRSNLSDGASMMWMSKKPRSPTVVDVLFAKPFRVPASNGAWVLCQEGTAWLTRAGHLADTILSPGDRAWVTSTDDAFVTGMPHCRLWIGAKREELAEL
jgi:hypothetical protein